MKLNVDLSLLWKVVHKMKAEETDFGISSDFKELNPIDKALNEGFELNLGDINFETGLASYKGRQVLLYIKDHGSRVENALNDGSKGNKYHIADCSMLDKMRKRGRFDRYVITNELTGFFDISGVHWESKNPIKGKTKLRVCKLCLDHLNYQGYRDGNRTSIFNSFKLSDFFDKYSSFFQTSPSGIADTKSSDYTEDWPSVSQKIKKKHHYVCQKCGVDVSTDKKLLHVHHKNGVKQDNSNGNLIPLCVDCHRKEYFHDHLFIPHDYTVKISHLRNSQHITVCNSWKDVYYFADPALYGIINLLEINRSGLPEIGREIVNEQGNVAAQLELSWPKQQIAVVISKETAIVAKNLGWTVWSMRNVLQHPERILRSFKA